MIKSTWHQLDKPGGRGAHIIARRILYESEEELYEVSGAGELPDNLSA